MNPHVKPPAEPQDSSLYVRTDVTPEALFQSIGRLRKEARDEIDRLLAFLDAIDGDSDLEPSLGFPDLMPGHIQPGHPGSGDDREDDADEENDPLDDEPGLGSVGAYGPGDQSDWSAGDRTDREEGLGDDEPSLGWTSTGSFGMPLHRHMVDLEDEHDGAEPDVCNEPSLGSRDREVNQVAAWQPSTAFVVDGEVDILLDDGSARAEEAKLAKQVRAARRLQRSSQEG